MQVIDIPIDTRYVEVNSPYIVAQSMAGLELDKEKLKRERDYLYSCYVSLYKKHYDKDVIPSLNKELDDLWKVQEIMK